MTYKALAADVFRRWKHIRNRVGYEQVSPRKFAVNFVHATTPKSEKDVVDDIIRYAYVRGMMSALLSLGLGNISKEKNGSGKRVVSLHSKRGDDNRDRFFLYFHDSDGRKWELPTPPTAPLTPMPPREVESGGSRCDSMTLSVSHGRRPVTPTRSVSGDSEIPSDEWGVLEKEPDAKE